MGAITESCCGEKLSQIKKQVKIVPFKKTCEDSMVDSKNKMYDSTNQSSVMLITISPPNGREEEIQNNECQTIFSKKCLEIHDFDILGLLGSGSYGGVYLVRPKQTSSTKSSQTYALKCISKKNFRNKKFKESAKLQHYILLNVTHPFIIDLKLSFENKSFVYFVMEYARGGPVDTLLSIKAIKGSKKNERNIRFKKLGEEGVRFIASCVVLALEHLHRYDIMYRDLKPENILIFDDGYIKLADFGLSKIMCGEEKSRTQAGTVVYFAPQVALKSGYTKLIDLWALGVFIYELATSQTPFRQDQIKSRSTFKQTVLKAQQQRNWKDFQLSNEIKDLINKLLKFKPTERIGAKKFNEIKFHPFFKGINWQKLEQKSIESPILSIIVENPFKIKEVKNISRIQKTESQVYEKESDQRYHGYLSLNDKKNECETL